MKKGTLAIGAITVIACLAAGIGFATVRPISVHESVVSTEHAQGPWVPLPETEIQGGTNIGNTLSLECVPAKGGYFFRRNADGPDVPVRYMNEAVKLVRNDFAGRETELGSTKTSMEITEDTSPRSFHFEVRHFWDEQTVKQRLTYLGGKRVEKVVKRRVSKTGNPWIDFQVRLKGN